MIKIFTKRKDNRGSSMIVAVIAIGFVAILASVIMSSAATNYKLKIMDNNSKKTFYSAESIIDEIYAGLGMECYSSLADAYTYAASNMVTQNTENGNVYLIQKTNAEVNEIMRERYLKIIKDKINSGTVADTIEYLNSFIKYRENASVVSISGVVPLEASNSFYIENMTVEYKQSAVDEYYSTVTVDIEIGYPDIEVDFASDSKDLKSYLDYCLIGMDGVEFGQSDTKTTNASVSGGAFAGGRGFSVYPGSILNVENDIVFNDTVVVDTIFVTPGDISLHGGNNSSTMNINNADIWCNSINVGDSYGKGILNFKSNGSNTYVADDLNLNGNGSKVTLRSKYIGFGNQGISNNSATSSAIIINGINCSINMSEIDYLLLAGKAYIDFGETSATQYMTADSLALKGNQEIYLVPAKYMSSDEGEVISNPTVSDSINVDLTDFFANKLGLLSKDGSGNLSGYVIKEVNGIYYYYLDFYDKDAQAEYVKCVIGDKYLESKLSGYTASDIADRNNLKTVINKSLNKFMTSDSSIVFAEDADVYTNGTLMQVSGNSMSVLNNALISYDDVRIQCLDATHRFDLLSSFLALDDNAERTYESFPSSIVIDGVTYTINGQSSLSNIYKMCIDTSKLEGLTENIVHLNEDGNGTIAAVITYKDEDNGATYYVPDTAQGGVILAYGVDVEVGRNFEGLIITNGEIHVVDTVKITTGSNEKAARTLESYLDVAQYFYAYQPGGGSIALDAIGIEDMLNLNNWRKNEIVYEVETAK